MSSARVEKDWQKKGLEAYGTEAILGTLAHYGVQVDEARFRTLAEKEYPLGIARGWDESWKGKGQFGPFPFAAAQELWRRWMGGKAEPSAFADSVQALVVGLGTGASKKSPSPTWPSLFEKVEAARSGVPQKDGAVEEAYGAELFQLLDSLGEDFVRAFDELAETLARAGHVAEAERFAELEEFLLPDRAGVVKAVVKAAKGDGDAAVADLRALLQTKRSPGGTLTAVDALLHLRATDAAEAEATRLLDEAEKAQDFHLGLALAERLALLYQWSENVSAMRELTERAEKLAKAHEEAHPHH